MLAILKMVSFNDFKYQFVRLCAFSFKIQNRIKK